MYFVKRFEFGKDELSWNEFIGKAKNSTFLFHRNFMDYHKERFVDHSLLVFNEKNQIIGCLPANEADTDTIVSHAGLTYGAVVLDIKVKLPVVIEIFYSIIAYYHSNNFKKLLYKAIPRIYNIIPSDEIDYCLFKIEAELYRRDTALVIDLENKIRYSGNIRREATKASNEGIIVQEEKDFQEFWNCILTPNLQERFGVNPVHSLEEINRLSNHFPQKIKLFSCRSSNEILCGTVIFETDQTIHCQYISSSNSGRESGALNLLFVKLIDDIYNNKKYFDFGIANEENGKKLNLGLLGWKERMGGRTISHDFYEIKTSSFIKVNKFI